MYEHLYAPDPFALASARLAHAIDAHADAALAEIKRMAERAHAERDARLGHSPSFINRSRGQRHRYARQRQLFKEAA